MKAYWQWTFYTLSAAFATYWLANLLLWFPWSYNAIFGMTMMFVAATPIWSYSVYNCLERSLTIKPVHGAIYTSLIFLIVAVALDYIFFGLIRNAITELYHPTTLYGYAFLTSLPFLVVFIFKRRLIIRKEIQRSDFVKFGITGIISFLAIAFITFYNLKLTESSFEFITMIFASLVVFFLVIWIVLGLQQFREKFNHIIRLSILCVVVGMLLGKYGAHFGLKWWIYYPVPMLMNVLIPPIVLKMSKKQIIVYLLLSFLSAPFIHFVFSFFFNWTEYMPFLKVPYIRDI